MKKYLASMLIALSVVACGPSWDKNDNDFALLVAVYKDYFTLEKIENYSAQKVYERYLAIAEKQKNISVEELVEIANKNQTKHTGNIRDELIKHIQKDKKILIVLTAYGPYLDKLKTEINDLLEYENIQLEGGELALVKVRENN